MRIIAGEFRGRRLLPPAGEQTRPVTDRVKQSVFDVISHLLEGARVYDCFAGTGSFGLEALSRGAAHVTFFESHRPTVALLQKNIATLGVKQRATVVTSDCFIHLANAQADPKVDLIFLDPPYRYLTERTEELRRAALAIASRHLAPTGQVLFRHDSADTLSLPALLPVDTRHYGSMTVEWLSPARDQGTDRSH
jgi:16S rRNA (guanine966-N2)-methyltransferase